MLKIEILVSINGIILMVFHTRARGWQFACIDREEKIYMDGLSFDSVTAALQEGREWAQELFREIN